jgi:hypothetical protein
MTVATKNNNKAPLVVPPAVRRRAGFKSGQELEFKASGGVITILPRTARAGEYTPAQRRVIDSRLAKAENDIKAGRVYGPFRSVEDMAASIEANIKNVRAANRRRRSGR